jgi:hypothetical protein
MQGQTDIDKLEVKLMEIWEEVDDETVLTLVTHEGKVSGFLELLVEVDERGIIAGTRWKWVVCEYRQNEVYSGTTEWLEDAAKELKANMESMAEYIKERDGR